MKLILAIIKPFKLDAVREALTATGIEGMTATEAKGFGRQKGQTEIYRGAEYEINFLPKMRLEIVVDDGQLEAACTAIREAANTDKIGDGKIFVVNVDEAIRIRTGENGSAAL
ncbi:MAG: P-II family nitrogen regulator [PS1 clade bacterium]|uniref:Nitrogen regulatory protein P-II n=1 Tax=PS1 clade bacterium TaxID=2175152 RepID=A0A937HDU8_9PROT|nr:P-II family nitrogen regulator [PS1 clade bacterium]